MYNPGLLEIYVQLISWNASLVFDAFFPSLQLGKKVESTFLFRKFRILHCNPTIQSSDFNFRFASVHLYLLNLYLDLYLKLSNFKLQFLSVNFYLLKMPECVVCQDVEGSYAFHDQHFVCSGCRECWIAVLDRENARVIRGKLEVKCSVCRKVCILRKGRRSSSVDLFFGFRIRLLFISFIRIITT